MSDQAVIVVRRSGVAFCRRSIVVALGALATLLMTSASALALSEGRVWEQVSPTDKHGIALEPIGAFGGDIQASDDGNAFTYVATGAPVAEPAGNRALELSQLFSTRTDSGWLTQDIATPHNEVTGLKVGENSEYKLFSADLTTAGLEPVGATPLPPLAPGAEKTIYVRHDDIGAFEPIVSAANTIPGAKFGEAGGNEVAFISATPDFHHVVFRSVEALTPDAKKIVRSEGGGFFGNLYMWADGALQLVSVLPNGESAASADLETALGYRSHLVRNAISDDGWRVVWESDGRQNEEPPEERRLYLRDMVKRETIRIDVPEPGAGGNEVSPVFEGATPDGSRVFFSDKHQLTSDSHAFGNRHDLYVADISTASGHLSAKITDLTKDSAEFEGEPEPADVLGETIGYSRDGSYVYFVADGILAPGATHGNCEESGQTCNLYVDHFDGHSWVTTFIAQLPSNNYPDWGNGSGLRESEDLSRLTAGVSPSGRYLAFMSNQALTGFDNHDAESGAADEEVFLYDAQLNRIICASCNFRNVRPQGVYYPGAELAPSPLLVDQPEIWSASHGANGALAGSVPGWTTVDITHALNQSRYVFDTGAVIFNSPDSLVPGDVNGKEDVYQYRQASEGCSEASVSATEVFKREDGSAGCVSLISSGTSAEESAFLDASASGADVFFLTSARLSATDIDDAFDVYDAHVCSTSSPCHVSSPPPVEIPCEEEGSCRAAAVAPGAIVAPTSATSSAAGNLPPTTTGQPRRKTSSQSQKLAKALKACRRHRDRRRRNRCRAIAKKRFQRLAASLPSKSSSG